MKKTLVLLSATILVLASCSKDEIEPRIQQPVIPQAARLIFQFNFDSTLTRLDNLGNPSVIPAGHSAQSPRFKKMSAHYIEFAPDSTTQLGNGEIIYQGAETSAGGSSAVDFNAAIIKSGNIAFLSKPLSQVATGTYKWIRVSLTYQKYEIDFLSSGNIYSGTLASFVGFKTYITSYIVNTQSLTINANKNQGYWGFETIILSTPYVSEGQAAGTTVPNPISSSSPIPAGSCVVTGSFPTPLTITGNETEDIIVTLNLSTNKSFEWRDLNSDGFFEPSDGVNPGDTVVDMGLRGLFPTYQ